MRPEALRDCGFVEPDGGDVVALRPEPPVPELVLEVPCRSNMKRALLPLEYSMKLDTPVLGGMPAGMRAWSGIRCPSLISTPFHWQSCLRISPRSLRYWLWMTFLPCFGANTMRYSQSHFVCARLLDFWATATAFPSGHDDPGDRHARGGGVLLRSRSASHPLSGGSSWCAVRTTGLKTHEKGGCRTGPLCVSRAKTSSVRRIGVCRVRQPSRGESPGGLVGAGTRKAARGAN